MTDTSLDQLIDVASLERFVNANVAGAAGPISVQKHIAGFSNETFYVTRGSEQWVLRRPPRGPLLPTAHDVVREYRYISALYGKARVPRPVAVCEDPAVIGAPFYLMERCDGAVIRLEVPGAYDDPAGRRAISEEMVEALVELHAVDWEAAGLSGKTEGYLSRQVGRWSKQWELTRPRTRELPGLDAATLWLRENTPESGPSTVVHGDYKLDNVMFAADRPKLLAIFDWEMATVGDPLADLGWLMSTWGDTGDPPPPKGSAWENAVTGAPVSAKPGFLSNVEMAALYEKKSGRSMQHVTFYHVLAVYKLAIILEGLYMHYLEATASNPESGRFEWQVPLLIARMQRLIAGSR
ncbi:MAG: phosphotransferase family protein [Anaerolinea sp.]|nr:phosphotransferase family protein [Anaerolinea sp.]